MNAIFDEVADWVHEDATRSVTCKFSNGHWRVEFNGQRFVPVRVASARYEIPEEALIACLESGLAQAKGGSRNTIAFKEAHYEGKGTDRGTEEAGS